MLRIPKSILQAKWSVCYSPFSSFCDSLFYFFCVHEGGAGRGGEVNFADFHAVDSDEEAAGLFSARCAPSPSQQNVKYLLDFFFSFFLLLSFGFHVDVISKLCLWLSPFVFDWSTRRVGFSKKKTKKTTTWTQLPLVVLKRERRKRCFYGTGVRRGGNNDNNNN